MRGLYFDPDFKQIKIKKCEKQNYQGNVNIDWIFIIMRIMINFQVGCWFCDYVFKQESSFLRAIS